MQTQTQLEKENAALKARIQELEALNNWYREQLKLSRQKQICPCHRIYQKDQP